MEITAATRAQSVDIVNAFQDKGLMKAFKREENTSPNTESLLYE